MLIGRGFSKGIHKPIRTLRYGVFFFVGDLYSLFFLRPRAWSSLELSPHSSFDLGFDAEEEQVKGPHGGDLVVAGGVKA